MSINKVFIGLPAYNEKDSINPLFEKIYKLKQTLTIEVAVIFYDDGSTDGTKEAVHEWMDDLSICYLGENLNHGLGTGINALLTYFDRHASQQDVLVVMDCDDTHDPAQITEMIKILETNHEVDVVVASRYQAHSHAQGVPYHRILMSLLAAWLFKSIHPIKCVSDYTCGYRLYTYKSIRSLFSKYSMPVLKEKGFACMVELLLKLNKTKAKIVEIPLLLHYENKLSISKMNVAGYAFRLLTKMLDWRIRGLGC